MLAMEAGAPRGIRLPVSSLKTIASMLAPTGNVRRPTKALVTDEATGAFVGSKRYISTCVPSSITRFSGRLKKRRLPLAFFNMKANKPSRQRAMPSSLEAMTVSRLRK